MFYFYGILFFGILDKACLYFYILDNLLRVSLALVATLLRVFCVVVSRLMPTIPALSVTGTMVCRSHTKKNFWVIIQGFARFGSNPNDGFLVGAFAFNVNNPSSHSNWNYGVSLNY
nr:MAG TPA: hypothetical protein [Caudoviricetes sp.]